MKRYVRVRAIPFPVEDSLLKHKYYKVNEVAKIINQLIDGIREKCNEYVDYEYVESDVTEITLKIKVKKKEVFNSIITYLITNLSDKFEVHTARFKCNLGW